MRKNKAAHLVAALVLGVAIYAPQSADAANAATSINTPVVSNRPTKSAGHKLTVKEKIAQIEGNKAERAASAAKAAGNATTQAKATVQNKAATQTTQVKTATQNKAATQTAQAKSTVQSKTATQTTQTTSAAQQAAKQVENKAAGVKQAAVAKTTETKQAVTTKTDAVKQSTTVKTDSVKQTTAVKTNTANQSTAKTLSKAEQKKAKEDAKAREKAEKATQKSKNKLKDTSKSKTSTDRENTPSAANSGWRNKVAQKNLKTLGYSSEAPNGKLTDTTKKALERFQKDHSLKVSGTLDDATYKKLNWKAFEKTGISNVDAHQVISQASKYKGVPYVFGGTTPKGFDCSGYVQYVFKNVKANLPRLADAQALEGVYINQSQLKPGDLVFFSTYEPGASHVGIYAGNHQFWNATSSRGVMLSSLKEDYWRTRYYGARRVLVKNGEIK